jgi:hypothetical protein
MVVHRSGHEPSRLDERIEKAEQTTGIATGNRPDKFYAAAIENRARDCFSQRFRYTKTNCKIPHKMHGPHADVQRTATSLECGEDIYTKLFELRAFIDSWPYLGQTSLL